MLANRLTNPNTRRRRMAPAASTPTLTTPTQDSPRFVSLVPPLFLFVDIFISPLAHRRSTTPHQQVLPQSNKTRGIMFESYILSLGILSPYGQPTIRHSAPTPVLLLYFHTDLLSSNCVVLYLPQSHCFVCIVCGSMRPMRTPARRCITAADETSCNRKDLSRVSDDYCIAGIWIGTVTVVWRYADPPALLDFITGL